MKTVFQRVVSVIMCVILVMGTMSTMAFAATSDFKYDRFKDATSKSVDMNITPVLDMVDEFLAEQKIYEEIDLPVFGKMVIDLTSIDKVCRTLDTYRGVINVASNDIVATLLNLGDIKNVNLSVFEESLSRADGDVKVVREFLELANANGTVISKLIDGSLNLGIIGELTGLDVSTLFGDDGIEGLVKGLIIGLVYDEGTNEYNTAYDKSLSTKGNDFESFIYGDLISNFISNEDGLLKGFELDGDSKVNDLLINVSSLVIDQYIISLLKDFDINLAETEFAELAGVLVLDGDAYDYNVIKFEQGKSIKEQINNVLGAIFTQIVPGYDWEEGSYTKIGANVEGLVRHLAGYLLDEVPADKEQLTVEVLRSVLGKISLGDYNKYIEGVAEGENLAEMAKLLLINVAKDMGVTATYTSSQTYDHVLGDILIEAMDEHVLIADANGKEVKVGSGKTVWEVANYILNFFFVDKNLDALLGKDGMTKTGSLFDKLDVICDMFADDGTADFNTKEYITGLIDAVFTLDLQSLVDETIVKAFNYVEKKGDPSVVEFLYKTVYYLAYNWAGKNEMLPSYTNAPFTKALSNSGIGQIAKSALGALSTRATGLASGLGLLLGLDETVSLDISVADMVYTGSAINPAVTVKLGGTVLEKNKDYTVAVNASGIGTATATITGIGAYEGQATQSFKVNIGKVSGLSYTSNASSVTLKWNAVPGAASYNVYNGSKLVQTVKTNSCTVKGLASGTNYTFKVEAVGGGQKSVAAQINASTTIGQVTGLKTSSQNTSVQLSWNSVKGATGYYVQCYIYGSWENLATVTGTSAVLSAAANTSYKYRVVAYMTTSSGAKILGTESAAVTVRTLPASPAKLSASKAAQSSVTLSWSAVSGVTGYAVEKYEKGSWKQVKTLTGTSYKVTGLASGTAYKFRVRAYVTSGGKNYYSAYSSAVSATTKVGVPAKLTFKTATATTVDITWNATAGAKGYQVWVKVGNKWKKTKTTKTSATIKNLSANKSYKIKIRAYDKNGTYGNFTAEITGSTAPAKATLKNLKAGKKRLTATWKKVSGAKGYEVVYSTSKKFTKKTTKTVTIKKAKTVKTTIKKLKKGKKYYVKVRAYKVVNGKKIYGSYSAVKNVKVK